MTQQVPSSARGWTVTLAALSINLILGALYAWGVIAKALVGQWHWSKADASLPFTVSTASFALTMIFAGRWQDKMGPRLVAMVGGVMFGAGLLASSYAHSPLFMLTTFGIIGGAGIGLCYSATTPPAIKWFPPARKGLVTGLVVSGVGIAAVYVSPLTQYLLGRTTIEQTFFILGLGAIVLICIFSQLLRNPPAGYVPAATAAPQTAAKKRVATVRADADWHEILRTRQFYQLWLMFVLSASAGLMIIMHVAIIAKEQAAWQWGFVAVALLAIFNTLGRLVSGFVSDRIGRTNTMILAFLLQAANMLMFSHYNTIPLVVFGASFTGLCYGTIFTLMPAATADFYGVKNLGVNYGLVFTAFGVAGTVGPTFGGWLRDTYGSYHIAYMVMAGMLVAGTILAVLTRPAKQPMQSAQQQMEKVGAE